MRMRRILKAREERKQERRTVRIVGSWISVRRGSKGV
jgi:hypothetical protein